MDLWTLVRDCFELDEGLLPEVVLDGLSVDELFAVYTSVRAAGGRATSRGDPATVWHVAQGCEVELDSLQDPIAMFLADQIEFSGFIPEDVRFCGVAIPSLGVRLTPDSIGLDYRMGPHWGPPEVEAYFKLLYSLVTLAPNCRFGFRELDEPQKFLAAWRWHIEANGLLKIPRTLEFLEPR